MSYTNIRTLLAVVLLVIVLIIAALRYHEAFIQPSNEATPQETINGEISIVGNEILLPLPRKMTNMSVEEAILLRRSIRDYTNEPLTINELSMILWAAQGITNTQYKFRAAPSAGATYPLELYVVIGNNSVVIDNGHLPAGVYKYNPYQHSLVLKRSGDYRKALYKVGLEQRWILEAPVNIVICAIYERTTKIYGERGIRYVHMEVGHVGQSIYLMTTALRLGTVVIGAFHDREVALVINAEENEQPLYIMPIGKPQQFPQTSFREINNFYSQQRGT